jgi:hypothetical protein
MVFQKLLPNQAADPGREYTTTLLWVCTIQIKKTLPEIFHAGHELDAPPCRLLHV